MPLRKGSATAYALSAHAVAARRNPKDPTLPQKRREIEVAKVEDRIRELVESAPPLTSEQRARLAALLAAPSEVDGE